MILVYVFYDLVKIRYLSSSIKHSTKDQNTNIRFFDEVKNIDLYIWLTIPFLLIPYNFQIFSISNENTLYYFYSATAQVFATLLGVVAMFGILILQKDGNKTAQVVFRDNILKKQIQGFLIIYIVVIILSVFGILVTNGVTMGSLMSLDSISKKNLINLFIFELTFLMIPAALLYLYAMIVTFLKLDDTTDLL